MLSRLAASSSETQLVTCQTTRRHIFYDRGYNIRRREKLKSHNVLFE
jgi:hypothetical protein